MSEEELKHEQHIEKAKKFVLSFPEVKERYEKLLQEGKEPYFRFGMTEDGKLLTNMSYLCCKVKGEDCLVDKVY